MKDIAYPIIITLAVGLISWLAKYLVNAVKKHLTEPVKNINKSLGEIHQAIAIIEIKQDGFVYCMQKHTGNGFSKNYDEYLDRVTKEKTVEKLIKPKFEE